VPTPLILNAKAQQQIMMFEFDRSSILLYVCLS
jgi:hypothetical protein